MGFYKVLVATKPSELSDNLQSHTILHKQDSLSLFSSFQSNGERETEKTQGPNPQSTLAPFMAVLGETFICPFLSWRKRVSSSARSELED